MTDIFSFLPNAQQSTASNKKKPCGYCNVKVGDYTLFSKPIWADSTSDDEFAKQLNQLALDNPEQFQQVIQKMLAVATIEVSMTKKSSGLNIADFL